MPENLTRTDFEKHLHSTFHLPDGNGAEIELQLVECNEGRSAPNYESFSLLFRGPRDRVLPQRTFELEHSTLGRMPLFLVPVKQDSEATYYESVFNRLRR